MASEEMLTLDDFLFLHSPQVQREKRKGSLEEIERELIERTLVECKWNKTLTAKKIGISRRALYEKAYRLGVTLNPADYLNRA